MQNINSYQTALFARRRIIELGYECGKNGAHFGSSLSLVDVLTSVYITYFKSGSESIKTDNRNRFILSKGHGALGYFAILEAFGFLTSKQTSLFEKNGSNFFAHAHKDLNSGIEYSGGSLGLGVSFSVGVALANRIRKLDSQIVVLAGDGECDEGIIWEALMSAAHYNLDNFTIIVDRNQMQSDGDKTMIMNHKDISGKLESFGFCVHEVDGHNHSEIQDALLANSSKPKAIIANTVKGRGISFMEANPDWHHGFLNEKQFTQALSELRN